MSNKLQAVNEISKRYDKSKIVVEDGVSFCPVCGKGYKTKRGIEKHMEAMNCYSSKDVFKDTHYEKDGLQFFNEISESRLGMSLFRKSKMYSGVMKFIVFCYAYEIKQMGLYYSFIEMECNRKNPLYILKAANDENNVFKFRKFLYKNSELIDSDFFETERERLLSDPLFFTRSLEKGHISIDVVINDVDVIDFVNEMPAEYFMRVETIYESV